MQTAGPFYPERLPDDSDNDLLRVAGRDAVARGEATELLGRVVDRDGRPLAGARVEIWQCDANGRYHHPRDPGRTPRDAGFQGFGRDTTDAEGRYRFRTIRPVPYPGRTPHVHFAVHGAGLDRPLVTQMYIDGHPLNRDDFVLGRVPEALRDLLLVPFEARAEGGWRAEFRIVVDAAGRLS
ncbi:MAG: protocatechuate 3,4-dioxygenase [Gammaproteobacteria bacterium]|nr:protocatechuate 3,4-dioxygenase [Gammaproteobacteria bacterium]